MAPSVWQVLIVLAIVVAILATRYRSWYVRQLREDLRDTPRVLSAETTKRKEAQFTRGLAPKRALSWAVSLTLVALVIAASWWASGR